MQELLRFSALECHYGAREIFSAVEGVLCEGERIALVGPNGAGKSSLLRTLSGLVRPRRGRMLFADRELAGLAPEEIVRLGIAHVPEGRGVIADLTVEENLRLGALWRGDRADAARALREAYELFPRLEERRRRSASTLSGGERQMLSIARALMGRPRLMLLDEPSLGLAPLIATQIMRVIAHLREQTGLTVLLVEQNAKSALGIADRGVVLSLGRVVADAAPDTLAADDKLRHAYLGF